MARLNSFLNNGKLTRRLLVRLTYLVVLFCCTNASSAQQFSIEKMLQFECGIMAIDADVFRSELQNLGLQPNAVEGLSVLIKSEMDCPQFEGNRNTINQERASYCENFLKHYFGAENIFCQTELIEHKPCDSPVSNPSNCSVTLVFSYQTDESSIIELEHTEPEITPIESVETPSTADLSALGTLNVGESLVLEGLNFQPGKHRILNEAKPVLKKLLTIMQENPTLQIEIQGHICCGKKGGEDGIDDETHKFNLSWTRAQFVYDYLIEHGIDKSRLTYKGYAMSQPLVYPEKTIQDQIKNRRVEVLITGK